MSLLRRPRPPAMPWQALLIVLFSVGLALLTGVAAGLGSRLLLAPFAAIIGVLVLALLPARYVVWALVLAAFLVVGPAIYYAGVEIMRWLAPGLAIALFIPWLLNAIGVQKPSEHSAPPAGVMIWYGVFLLAALFSTLLSSPSVAEQIFASRMYLAYVGLALVVSAGLLHAQDQWRIWYFLLWAAVLQAPFAVLQAVSTAKARDFQGATWDAVVGTFPGNADTGGANAGMSIFCVVALVVALSLRQRGHLSRGLFLLVLASTLICMAAGEVKAVVLMLPLAALVYFWPQVLRRPVRSLVWVGLGILCAMAFLWAYNDLYYANRNSIGKVRVPLSAQESIANQLNPSLEQRGNIMGRMASFYDWAQRHDAPGDLPFAIVGHGFGSLQFGRLGVGEVAQALSYRADNTATGLLLWETGLLGHALVVGFFIAGAVSAFRLRDAPGVPSLHQAIGYALCTAFVLHLICLPYKDFMFRAPPNQVLLFLMVGYVAYWTRVSRGFRDRKA